MAIIVETNEYQTPVTDSLLGEYPDEVKEQFLDFITTVPFIRNLIAPNRPRVEDLPRDEKGRAIVDITNPPVFKDADYFRQTVIYYQKNGCYTSLKPNSNPNSEYRKFWEREKDRIWNGMVRESDGMWVTGFMYWLLNYCPMMINVINPSTKKAIRKKDFGLFWEGIWWRFMYLHNARENGHHAAELARRGASKSYGIASMLSHNLIMGENSEAKEGTVGILTAYQKEYLKDDKDGTLSKFVPVLSHVANYTPFPHLMLKNSSNEMTWQMGYTDANGNKKGSMNMAMGVSAKDDSDKLRGKRGYIYYEEFGNFPNLLELYDVTRKSVEDGDYTFGLQYLIGCVCKGTKVWTLDGRNIPIEQLRQEEGIVGFTNDAIQENAGVILRRGSTKEPIVSPIITSQKECVRVTLSSGNIIECSTDHPILIHKFHANRREKNSYYTELFREAGKLSVGDKVLESRYIDCFGDSTLFDARLVGMLIGGGTYGSSVKYCSEDKELNDYVHSRYETKVFRESITSKGRLYQEYRVNGVRGKLNEIGILGQTKTAKRLPDNWETLTREDSIKLLSGLYDTDGCIHLGKKDGHINITQSNREILEQIQTLWRKFGVVGSIIETQPTVREGRKDKNHWFSLIISGRFNSVIAANVLDLLVERKRKGCDNIIRHYESHPSQRIRKYPSDVIMHRVVSVEPIGKQVVYNLTAGLSHTYLANNIITHNTANNKEANFQSAKTLLYAPKAYNIEEVTNVYDKKGQGNQKFAYFFPAFINRAGCYNEDGISDVVKALLQILQKRYDAKYGADPTSVLRVIAEDPITPAEAIIKVKDAFFPVQALTERAQQLDMNHSLYDEIYVGDLYVGNGGTIGFKPTADVPIRSFPVSNDTLGALEIYQMPVKDREGKIFDNRYLISADPYDNDQAESSSLYSIFVLDLFSDMIVAEYTGRTRYADEAHEMVRKLCLFYNGKCLYESNKKGLFSYMERMRSAYLLADTPEYLRDKQLIKYSGFGSNAKGVNASAPINNFANGLIKDWLNKLVEIEVKDDDGSMKTVMVPQLYKLKNRALIEELIQFNPVMNFDRIRSMGMLMLYREEYLIKYNGNLSESAREERRRGYLGDDDFFTKNYEGKRKGCLNSQQLLY